MRIREVFSKETGVRNCYVFFCCFAGLLLSGCSTAKNAQIAEVPFSTIQTYIASSEGSVDLVRGGGITRRLKQDRRFENLRLYLVPETNIVVRQEYYLIISATSTEGQAVVKILKEEKPWTWNDPGLQPFANHLSLTGHLGTNKWEYDSIYPDPKIARLMGRIRKELRDLVPN